MKDTQQMYFSDVEVGKYYSVSRGTIRRWARKGKFPPGKKFFSGTRRWSRTDLQAFDQELDGQKEGVT